MTHSPAITLDPTTWDFPATHKVKAIGLKERPVVHTLVEITQSLELKVDHINTTHRLSRSGKYISVTMPIHFEHALEVQELYQALHAHPDIVQSL